MRIRNYTIPSRFLLMKWFVILFLGLSFLIRAVFLIGDFAETEHSVLSVLQVFAVGLFFDIGTVSFFLLLPALYLLLLPKRYYGTMADRIITYTGFILSVLIVYFSFFAEITFWDEFQRRFNFIAVDYLIYTYEVFHNINESYPLPILLGGMAALVVATVFLFRHFGIPARTFKSSTTFRQRLFPTLLVVAVVLIFSSFVRNEAAEVSANRINNELSKAGIYSFFAAFRNNELSYPDFYRTVAIDTAFSRVKSEFRDAADSLLKPNSRSIERFVKNKGADSLPNIIFICVESLSADYLGYFGNQDGLTPVLDSLAGSGMTFTNLFATGTRTVRGMEAITLSIPPTPGRSIVKRQHNQKLFTIGEVFKEKGYSRTFFYGGDGYFDNMDRYFSGNGFDIVDRGRRFLPVTDIATRRFRIPDANVTFENAWGVCDEDIYNAVLEHADNANEKEQPFFDFIMTTSNHKPYTYPEGRIGIPSGTGRSGAVRYTDFAIGKFLSAARTKPWYDNTVFVIMADHCASSAGRWELDVANYHIPAIIVNLPGKSNLRIDKLCSQIDIFPTLFGQLGWDYKSNLFGIDVLKVKPEEERAFIGNYRKLGLMRDNKVLVLGDQKKASFYRWQQEDNSLQSLPLDNEYLEETISFFQVADYLYQSGGLTLKANL
jgi:phosphoglycerol transferase MdoB-like AlkP superfamily enzyme